MNFGNRIKAMTLNTQCWNVTPERLVNLPIMVRNYMPDVLGVQEATPKWIETLTEALPEYACVGVGREANLRGEEIKVLKHHRCEEPINGEAISDHYPVYIEMII